MIFATVKYLFLGSLDFAILFFVLGGGRGDEHFKHFKCFQVQGELLNIAKVGRGQMGAYLCIARSANITITHLLIEMGR